MASPQRRPDPENLRELEDMRHRDLQREVGHGWRFGFWWIWILVFIAIWWVAFGWGNSGGFVWARHGAGASQAVNDAVLSGPGLPILNAGIAGKHACLGQAFIIRNVPVERVAGPHALWIGNANNSIPMLLVAPADLNARSFAHGEWLNVTGRIQEALPPAQAQHQWGLSTADAQALQKQGVYIQANSVLRALRESTTTTGR
jgi:hypothetical protein